MSLNRTGDLGSNPRERAGVQILKFTSSLFLRPTSRNAGTLMGLVIRGLIIFIGGRNSAGDRLNEEVSE